MENLSDAERVLQRWRREPLAFVRQAFNAEPDPWQAKELEELPKHDRVAIAGSKGCAKTTFFTWAMWWSLTTQPHVKGAATSINGAQLRDGLWAELAKWQSKSPLLQELFHWSPERVVRKTAPATWFASARTWNQSADPHTQAQALAGFRSENCFFVIDEAGGVPAALLATVDAVLATKKGRDQIRVWIGGNTTSTNGALYTAVVKQRQMWHCVRITSDPDDPLRTPRVTKEWARQQIQAYGRDNPWVKINVFAEFPDAAVGKLLSLSDIEAAAARPAEENRREPLVLGVDVGMVTDACVIYPRRGRMLYPPKVLRGASTIVIAGEIVAMVRELGATTVFLDLGGPGIGVGDTLRAMGQSFVPVYFGGAADDSTRFLNKRVEMYVRLAEWVKTGGAIGKCPELEQDLLEPEMGWNLKGQQVLEPKDEVKARLGRSPDWGDGAALTFAYPVAAVAPQGEDELRAIARAMRGRGESHDEFGFGGGR
ncbi:MAG: Xanthomonas citri phage [Pseudomonadota bacterium]|jgi:hypothetical protein